MQAGERGLMTKRWLLGVVLGLASNGAWAQQVGTSPATAPAAPTTAVAAAQGTTSAAPAKKTVATPGIWRVKGTKGTVYLFGSVHVMRPDVEWVFGLVLVV